VGHRLPVLDSYAVIASAGGEATGAEVDVLLRSRDGRARISAANLTEMIDRLVRVHGLDLSEVRRQLDLIEPASLDVVPVDKGISQRAGELRARHYDRERSAVSLGDCLALATALALSEPLATPDPALAAMARAGVEVVALPDSQGRPAPVELRATG
jgi:PIN domain nuclease of toxin-antitoxin system